MSVETTVIDTTSPDTVAQSLIINKILESREHMLAGIDLESEGGKGVATMYDRGVSDALTAVTDIGQIVVPLVGDGEGDTPVDYTVSGTALNQTFWEKVNN